MSCSGSTQSRTVPTENPAIISKAESGKATTRRSLVWKTRNTGYVCCRNSPILIRTIERAQEDIARGVLTSCHSKVSILVFKVSTEEKTTNLLPSCVVFMIQLLCARNFPALLTLVIDYHSDYRSAYELQNI
jgi:hypothetical protein